MERPNVKRVRISNERQISIPKEFYDQLHLKDEALIELSNSSLIIRPTNSEHVDLSEYILKDLVKQGYEGDELIKKFSEIKKGIPQAIDKLTREALANKTMTADMSLDEFLDGS